MKIILKITISSILIGVIIFNLDLSLVIENIKNINVWAITLVFLISLIQIPISAYKWGISLIIHNLYFSFFHLLKLISIGFFFNNFLPTSIGGDVYRIIKTIPDNGYKSRAISSVLLERIPLA